MFGFSLLVQQEKDLSMALTGLDPSLQLLLNFTPVKQQTFVTRTVAQVGAPSVVPTVELKALPPEFEALVRKYAPLCQRVMDRLSEAERKEANLHLRADYRQSWICLSLANKGIADPFVQSSYQIYGLHPSKVWEAIVADRKARLGAEYYDWYDSADMPRPDVPKIPPVREAEHYERLDALTNFTPSGLPVSAPDTGEGDNLPPNRKPSPVHPLTEKGRLA